MNQRQQLAYLVAIARQSMELRETTTLDGEAVNAVLAAAGPDGADVAALAINEIAGQQ